MEPQLSHEKSAAAQGPLLGTAVTDDSEIEEIRTASFMAAIEKPVQDESRLWEAIGAAQFCSDGVAEGWDSDTEETETAEEKYLKVSNQTLSFPVPVCAKGAML